MSGAPGVGAGAHAGGPLTIRSDRRHRRVRRAALAVTATGIAVLVGPWIWTHGASAGRLHDSTDIPAEEVALVLGAGVGPDGRPSGFLAARLDLARALYKAGRVEVLLVSGDNSSEHYDEPTAMKRYLVAHGVPEQKIVPDYAGRDTYDSCARVTRIFGVDRLVVVSQAYHLPRALAICSALGVDAVGVGDSSARRWSSLWREGQVREVFANVKAALDVLTRRDPVLGPPETGVRDALGSG
ncbi:SanA/YdcF family protein [Agilicoccus flavus]|uniref:SanA/YdcF family protein n=1 Tax=Agilicoccus flavus TaxID=2775968 RepID=UPI001CF674E1|nr:ElyC/SanA/YdcF family protein [Agilicoccus flavus]